MKEEPVDRWLVGAPPEGVAVEWIYAVALFGKPRVVRYGDVSGSIDEEALQCDGCSFCDGEWQILAYIPDHRKRPHAPSSLVLSRSGKLIGTRKLLN